MLEGYFSFKDLDDIKFELQMLEGVNLYTLKQCLKILDKFDSQYSNNIEKLQLQILKQKYQKLRTADKIYKEIEKDLSSRENFVKTINLANYEENYTIKTEFIPKIFLNLPICFSGYSGSCIENTGTNKTKINNLLVKANPKIDIVLKF